jgi:hypothetical protein
MKSACRLTALVAFLAAAPVLADDAPAGPPKPAPEMAQLGYLAGTWHCAGKAFASPMGPEHATQGVAHAQMALDGFRLVIHYDETKTAANPMPYHVLQVVGWDAGAKAFDSACFDSMGSSCSQTTKGWNGSALVFEGAIKGMTVGARDTFTKVSESEMTHKGEMQGEGGKWAATDEETCHRAGAAAKKN